MSDVERTIVTVTLSKAIVVDDYGIQVTDNPDWKQMRADGLGKPGAVVPRPSFSS